MKSLLSKIGSLFVLTLLVTFTLAPSSGFANQKCAAKLQGWVHVPAGTPYWGTYKCSGPGCQIITSAMPDSDGVTRCEGCGKPHSGESFIDPQTKNDFDGELYVLDPGGIGDTKLAESGLKWSCPECSATNFRVQHTCKNCSAPQPKDFENFLVDENGEFVNRNRAQQATTSDSGLTSFQDGVSTPLVADVSSDTNADTSDTNAFQTTASKPLNSNLSKDSIWQEKQEPQQTFSTPKQNNYEPAGLDRQKYETPQKPWRAWVKRGGAVLAAITATTIIWGVHTFSEPGYVTQVDSARIVVEYQHHGDTYTAQLDPQIVASGVRWHAGEPITLHFSNFYWVKNHTAQGAERANAEVYAPILLERNNRGDH